MAIKKYILSQEADFDLEDIFDYTKEEFGLDQAVHYLTEINILFEKLILTPHAGRSRNEIKLGLYSIMVNQHIIFYRILTSHIRIVRVMHGSRDLPKFLK